MLFVRLLMFLLWPVRLPLLLLRTLFRAGRGARSATRAGQAAVAGGASKLTKKGDRYYRRYSGIWQVFDSEANDETVIRPDQDELAQAWAKKAQLYYEMRPELFPKGDFYEEVERDHFISVVAKIETGEEGGEDQFVRLLRQAREIANANARTLYCEFGPLVLLAILGWQVATVLFDPFRILVSTSDGLESQLVVQGFASAAIALGIGVLFVAFIYRFSFTHIQRQNAQELNSFIASEFTSLNQSFNVARAECMQAETRFDSTQHDLVEPRASSWALAYHWIAVRQLTEELTIRNNMFQIRRNTWLYMALGILICILLGVGVTLAMSQANAWVEPRVPAIIGVGQVATVALAFLVIAYGLIMRGAFSIFASRLPKDEWSRFDKLRIGEAISEQVGRDKKQIVIQRDRRT